MIAVVHAFSRRNAGDSLLVDFTLGHLERAGIPRRECCLFALDPDSFEDLPRVVKVPAEPWGRLRPSILEATVQLLESGAYWASRGRLAVGHVARSLGAADGIIAVGGGYLRADTTVHSVGTLLNHVPQLAVAATSDRPTVYLPQSIGPLRGPVGALTRRLLGGIDTVYARDGRTVTEIAPHCSVRRMPDLAVLAIGDRGVPRVLREGGPRTVMVARSLAEGEAYEERLRMLDRAFGRVEWAIQARGLGGRSDADFYERLGVRPSRKLTAALSSGHGVVVSVRLHGALQAILRGWPAIHLAYERKGWGAYRDLGIEEFVHPVESFDPDLIVEQARRLEADPSGYWRQMAGRFAKLRIDARSLQKRLRRFARDSSSALPRPK